jgi:molybdopterin-guanine dinucleotide biosynthesis protein A
VLLAGGASRRFGRDKLLAEVDHLRVITRVAEHLVPLSHRLFVSVATPSRATELQPYLPNLFHPLVDDRARYGAGPGGAIAQGLDNTGTADLLFVPADLPWVTAGILRHFAQAALTERPEVAVPYWGGGETENLLQWHHRASKDSSLDVLPVGRPRGLRASDLIRRGPAVTFVPISMMTRERFHLAHLTTPEDLATPRTKGKLEGHAQLVRAQAEPAEIFRAAVAAWRRADFATASTSFHAESEWYRSRGFGILARHASEDAELSAQRTPLADSAR